MVKDQGDRSGIGLGDGAGGKQNVLLCLSFRRRAIGECHGLNSGIGVEIPEGVREGAHPLTNLGVLIFGQHPGIEKQRIVGTPIVPITQPAVSIKSEKTCRHG